MVLGQFEVEAGTRHDAHKGVDEDRGGDPGQDEPERGEDHGKHGEGRVVGDEEVAFEIPAEGTAPTSQMNRRPQTETHTAWRTVSGSARKSRSSRLPMLCSSFMGTFGRQPFALQLDPGRPSSQVYRQVRRTFAAASRGDYWAARLANPKIDSPKSSEIER